MLGIGPSAKCSGKSCWTRVAFPKTGQGERWGLGAMGACMSKATRLLAWPLQCRVGGGMVQNLPFVSSCDPEKGVLGSYWLRV